jgi:hypothetical protein
MDLPSLRHFSNSGIYFVSSDPVEALVGEAWVPAVYTDKGWATADGASLLLGIEEWRNASEERQVTKGDLSQHQSGDEGGQASKTGSSNRPRQSRKKPQA